MRATRSQTNRVTASSTKEIVWGRNPWLAKVPIHDATATNPATSTPARARARAYSAAKSSTPSDA